MASFYQTEPSLQRLDSSNQQYVNDSNGVNSITQLSIGHSYDSCTTTSTNFLYNSQTNTNQNGNLLFPFAERVKNTIEHTEKMSWQNLLKYLKSQRIVKNIEIFKNFKNKPKHKFHTQQFPFRETQLKKEHFPYQKYMENNLNEHKFNRLKRKEPKLKKFIFSLSLSNGKSPFSRTSRRIKPNKQNDLKMMRCKMCQLNLKLKHYAKLKRFLRKLPMDTNLKIFSTSKTSNLRKRNKFPANFLSPNEHNKINNLKFPQKLSKNEGKFPYANKSQSKTNFNIQDFNKQQFRNLLIVDSLQNTKNFKKIGKQNLFNKFPVQLYNKSNLAALSCVKKFPLSNQFTPHEHSFNDNIKILKNPKTLNSLASLSMTQNDYKMENKHVFQVQDAQVHVEENSQSLTKTENKQASLKAELGKTVHDKHGDVNTLADINSINKTLPNEVRYYAEKIECIQNIIVALFEKIQNSLRIYGSSENESTNAAEYDHGNGNIRFALTPPMSTTSVLNVESKNVNKYDLDDLCDRQFGQAVECSEVRDTLAEAVDYGVTKEQIKSTGSYLVKSEESTSPNSLALNPLVESVYKSPKDYTAYRANELLAKNLLAVNEEIIPDIENNLEYDTNNKIDTREKWVNARENNLISADASETTVTRLKRNEQENTNKNNHSQPIEVPVHGSNTLRKNLLTNEMKFEMNRAKGALPNSVPERPLDKHENLKAETNSRRLSTDASLSSNKLPHAYHLTRNSNDNSLASRLSLRNENDVLATNLRPDGIKNRSAISITSLNDRPSFNTSSLNDATLNRVSLNNDTLSHQRPSFSTSTFNDGTSNRDASSKDTLFHRRTSLEPLRNKQSTFLTSVDLPQNTPLTALNSSDKNSLVNRATSVDSSLDSVLPERTRLRRQRRLRTLSSQDESEDPIERLNRLKARISASLSEVKGVLKQYSTENENDNEIKNTNAVTSAAGIKEDEKKEGPIVFRFVKKVRRRSLFLEDDENEQDQTATNAEFSKEKTDTQVEQPVKTIDETDNCRQEMCSILPTANAEIEKISNDQPLEIRVKANDVSEQQQLKTNDIELNTDLYTLKEEAPESLEDLPLTENKAPTTLVEQETSKIEPQHLMEETKGAIPKPAIRHEIKKSDNDSIEEIPKKNKKKIILKSKDPLRRASLAAVEGSKIEPPVKLAVPAMIQRRPSDSEAMVKKKSITAKLNTSGVVEEVTPKPKIVKVKKSSTKSNNNSQLAATQTKIIEDETSLTTTSKKSDDHVKSIDKDNKSIHTDKNEDVLMPKQLQPEERQQQTNAEITRQTNLLLPTQLVIDEAASLNEKTIQNSMLTPRQQQQKQDRQQQPEQEQDKQATINSTATNFKSNDLHAKDAMLENVTTVLSSSTASEANGQIKRENVVQLEDFHDFLQQEATIIKPSATNKQNELKPVKQVEANQTQIEDSIVKSNGNSESRQSTAEEQHQKSSAHQQVIATTFVAHVKGDEGDNKYEDIKGKVSLKQPCKDKTTTSTHVEAEHQQRGDEQSIANVDNTKTTSSPHISISSTSDITHKTTTAPLLPSQSVVEEKAEASANKHNAMPELKLAPPPVQTADISSHPELHKKKIIIKKIVRQSSVEKAKKTELNKTKPSQEAETKPNKTEPIQDAEPVATEPVLATLNKAETTPDDQEAAIDTPLEITTDELTEECSESTEISESSASVGSEEVTATDTPKKERIVKKKVIIKREKRRLSVGDNFFHLGSSDGTQNAEIETLEKPIAYVSDDESEQTDENDEEAKGLQEQEEVKKPLKSCILRKEYNIGDEVLYAERFKKTQIKWRHGRIKERITSISYLLDIDGKDVSSHINYLKKFTGRKVSFGGKEYLEIDYEQLAEEEEKAERIQKRSCSIWNMV